MGHWILGGFFRDPFSMSFTASETKNVNGAANYTSAALSIGAAPTGSNTRHVVAAISLASNGGNAAVTVSAVTIGGVAATKIIERLGAGSSGASAGLWYAAVPTGTTAVVAATCSSVLAGGVSVYRLINMTTAGVVTSNSSSTGAATLSLNVASGDAAIACSAQRDGSASTWVGLTEDYDTDARTNEWMSSASTTTNTGTPLTITCTRSGASDAAAACATFR